MGSQLPTNELTEAQENALLAYDENSDNDNKLVYDDNNNKLVYNELSNDELVNNENNESFFQPESTSNEIIDDINQTLIPMKFVHGLNEILHSQFKQYPTSFQLGKFSEMIKLYADNNIKNCPKIFVSNIIFTPARSSIQSTVDESSNSENNITEPNSFDSLNNKLANVSIENKSDVVMQVNSPSEESVESEETSSASNSAVVWPTTNEESSQRRGSKRSIANVNYNDSSASINHKKKSKKSSDLKKSKPSSEMLVHLKELIPQNLVLDKKLQSEIDNIIVSELTLEQIKEKKYIERIISNLNYQQKKITHFRILLGEFLISLEKMFNTTVYVKGKVKKEKQLMNFLNEFGYKESHAYMLSTKRLYNLYLKYPKIKDVIEEISFWHNNFAEIEKAFKEASDKDLEFWKSSK